MKKRSLISILVLTLVLSLTLIFNQPVKAATIKLNYTTVKLLPKQKVTLKISGTKKKVTWSSSKKSVATVSKKGVVTAKKAGKATITAKVAGKKKKCKIIVKSAKNFAKELHAYILKNGKSPSPKTNPDYKEIKKTYTTSTKKITVIFGAASYDKNHLHFYYNEETGENEYDPSYSCQFEVGITSSKFNFTTYYTNGDYGDMVKGTVTKAKLTKDLAGVTFDKFSNIDEDEADAYRKEELMLADSKKTLKAAFKYHNKFLKTSKFKLSLKKIGFTKYS